MNRLDIGAFITPKEDNHEFLSLWEPPNTLLIFLFTEEEYQKAYSVRFPLMI